MLKTAEIFPVAADAERVLDRRRFLWTVAAAAGLAVVGECAARALEALRRRRLETIVDARRPLAVGEARAVVASDGRETLVVRLAEEEVVAFDRRCPHLGCPVLWSAEHVRFECPCHHAAFDARSGRVLFGPPRRGLDPAIVRIG